YSSIPIQRKERVKEWFDEECEQITKEKNEAYLCMLQGSCTRGSTEEYKKRRREEKKIHRRKKRLYETELAKEIEENRVLNIRKFYKRLMMVESLLSLELQF
ncbi:hypothetical protein C0J52_24853, partial [Blattella germanica]